MKKAGVFILLFLMISACEKDKIESIDYSNFLARDFSSFYGSIGKYKFAWHSIWSEPYNGYVQLSYQNEYDNLKINEVLMSSRIISENYTQSISLSCPILDITNENDYNELFSPGVKILGNKFSDFYFQYTRDNMIFGTDSLSKSNTMEILKTEKYYDTGLQDSTIRLWIVMSGDLTQMYVEKDSTITMTEGQFVADFNSFKYLKWFYDYHFRPE